MNNFDDYKSAVASEKITLAIIEASKRLIAFSVHAGFVYKLENFDVAVISSIKESGINLTEVSDIASVAPGSFYNDRESKILYLRTVGSGNPNLSFIHITLKLFFANVPVTLPHNLLDGYEVYWEPTISSTSDFDAEIDTVDQQNEVVEGSGTLTLWNDGEFWSANFDKMYFENQKCEIYSWNRELEANQAKLIFRGTVESREYSPKSVVFKLKDLLAQLRNSILLSEISELGRRNSPENDTAKQRMILGKVQGHLPINLDCVIDDSYPLPGTASVTNASAVVTGSGMEFLKRVSPDDRLEILDREYTVATVDSDTQVTLTEVFSGITSSGLSIEIIPNEPKRWINRSWNLAGHTLRQPVTTIEAGSSSVSLFLGSTRDMFDGDFIYVGALGSGELVRISRVVNDYQVVLANSLTNNPTTGTQVIRPCVQKVMIDDTELVFYRDYTVDPVTAELTLRETAEANAAPVRQALISATFTNGSRTVTGTGTNFKSTFKPGYLIRPTNTVTMFEVLSVESDVQMKLRTAFVGTTVTAQIHYKSLILDPEDNVLHCELLGRTDDGTTSGILLRKAPEMIYHLLKDAGYAEDQINHESLIAAQELVPEEIAFVVPSTYGDTSSTTYRDVMNKINKSVFGILFQNNDFKMSYDILRPVIPASPISIKESDCISWSMTGTNKNMISRAVVQYGYKEYDYVVKEERTLSVNKTSDVAKYILATDRQRTFESVLANEQDAQRLCNRWLFLLENSSSTIKISTKLQLIDAQINDIIDFEHRKFYERFAGTSKRKFLAIEKIYKSGSGVTIECADLSNAFNRIALISDTTTTWANSDEETKIHTGFISDETGLIDNDASSFGTNLIW